MPLTYLLSFQNTLTISGLFRRAQQYEMSKKSLHAIINNINHEEPLNILANYNYNYLFLFYFIIEKLNSLEIFFKHYGIWSVFNSNSLHSALSLSLSDVISSLRMYNTRL